jgi:DUF4097 and DUF4098 domain-containing protein YvlB
MLRINTCKNLRRRWLPLAIIVFLLVLSKPWSYAATVDEVFTKQIPFQQGGFLELHNSNGGVEVQSWDKNEVEIKAYKRVRAGNKGQAEELMQELKIEVVQTATEIKITTITPAAMRKDGGFFDWLFNGDNNSCSVEYQLLVPKSIDLNIETTNGKVYCQQIKGRLRLNSTNGKITAREIEGLVRSKTTNGSLDIEFISVPSDEEINFSTTNGSITLRLPENYGAEVNLKTTNGHIDSDFSYTEQGDWSRQHVSGIIGDGTGTLYCHTTNGSIRLYSTEQSTADDVSL